MDVVLCVTTTLTAHRVIYSVTRAQCADGRVLVNRYVALAVARTLTAAPLVKVTPAPLATYKSVSALTHSHCAVPSVGRMLLRVL